MSGLRYKGSTQSWGDKEKTPRATIQTGGGSREAFTLPAVLGVWSRGIRILAVCFLLRPLLKNAGHLSCLVDCQGLGSLPACQDFPDSSYPCLLHTLSRPRVWMAQEQIRGQGCRSRTRSVERHLECSLLSAAMTS